MSTLTVAPGRPAVPLRGLLGAPTGPQDDGLCFTSFRLPAPAGARDVAAFVGYYHPRPPVNRRARRGLACPRRMSLYGSHGADCRPDHSPVGRRAYPPSRMTGLFSASSKPLMSRPRAGLSPAASIQFLALFGQRSLARCPGRALLLLLPILPTRLAPICVATRPFFALVLLLRRSPTTWTLFLPLPRRSSTGPPRARKSPIASTVSAQCGSLTQRQRRGRPPSAGRFDGTRPTTPQPDPWFPGGPVSQPSPCPLVPSAISEGSD